MQKCDLVDAIVFIMWTFKCNKEFYNSCSWHIFNLQQKQTEIRIDVLTWRKVINDRTKWLQMEGND